MIEELNYKAMDIVLLEKMKKRIEEVIAYKLKEPTDQQREDIIRLFSQGVTVPETGTTYSMQEVIEIAVDAGLLGVYADDVGIWEKNDYNSIWTNDTTHAVMLDITA